ncbi:MAG: hypothetical protein WC796_03360 [Candidatus Pacearchaeota archaeon]|jgi:hypothetical protein
MNRHVRTLTVERCANSAQALPAQAHHYAKSDDGLYAGLGVLGGVITTALAGLGINYAKNDNNCNDCRN